MEYFKVSVGFFGWCYFCGNTGRHLSAGCKEAEKSNFLIWSVALVIAGGVGNLIDRIFRHFVIDYIEVRLINFAVFNFADCCVVIGTIMIVCYLFI